MIDVIIIGAGPAGLTAAIYAKRANKSVKVFEALNYGGQIINTMDIENYPAISHISGFEYATELYNQAKELGVEVVFEKVEDISVTDEIKKVTTKNGTYEAKTIIIATGNKNRQLGLTDEEKFIGKGISYCATCDGAFYKGKTVAVVGGGNTALEDAIYLADVCEKVYLIHRKDSFRADDVSVNTLKKLNNIECIYNSNVTKITGNDKIESIEVTDNDGNIKTISIDGLFIAIGRIPDNLIFSEYVDLDNNGYIIAEEDCKTKTPGIFVAGDTRKKEIRQLVTATSDGAVAATLAVRYINSKK